MTDLPISGVYEHFFGVEMAERDDALAYWRELGFTPIAEGTLSAADAATLYGHRSALVGIRLAHPGSALSGCGYVRLQLWETLRNRGLGLCPPLSIGGRWMGLYTTDILTIRDAYLDAMANDGWDVQVSEIVHQPLDPNAPPPTFFRRFVGLREMMVKSERFRHAFIQRAGFDRPGFGHFVPGTPLPVTEGTHANIVQPTGQFDTSFYKRVFGLESLGGGGSPTPNRDTREVLGLREGQGYQNERLGAPGTLSGRLQVYCPLWHAEDLRDRSRAGSLGLCLYSFAVADLAGMRDRLIAGGAANVTPIVANELGEPSVGFDAPDGNAWVFVGRRAA
ncbi:MAG: hypothetical protein NZ518_01575 [Dehalococcoidia bacterium]|nr:hypothetical protein [Dehalococcoidia bacterium]